MIFAVLRSVAVDLFGTDEDVDLFEADDLAELLLFDFEDVPLDDALLDERNEEQRPPFVPLV